MKKSILLVLALFTFRFQSNVFAQTKEKLTYYVGVGPAIDGNIGLWGVNISNELSFGLGKRTSLNPSLTYYQSIASFDTFDEVKNDNSSGLFTNLTFKYDVLQTTNDFRISLAFGPSFQLGSQNTFSGTFFMEDVTGTYYEDRFDIESFARIGYTQQVAFDWKSKNENRRNSAVVSMSSFGGYWPWYLMATYRMGFKLK